MTERTAAADEPDGSLLSVEVARSRVLDAVDGPLPPATVPIEAALGRVASARTLAMTDLPPWDNSAMDGYALRAIDIAGASEAAPVVLRVVGEAAAGGSAGVLAEPGTAIRIATGAPLPVGVDAVVQVELTTALDSDGSPAGVRGRQATAGIPAAVMIHSSVPAGASIRRRGSDLESGTIVLEPGTRLGPADIGLVAGAGVGEVAVHRRPTVAVLATGDEVRPTGSPLGASGIPDANGPGLRALAAAAGADVLDLGIARDRLDDVIEHLRRGVAGADVVIVSGGVSVGPYDVVRAAFDAIGSVSLWRVALQPGKPFAFGTAPRPDGQHVLLFGLPGNPVSSYVTFEIFVRPALRRLAGHRDLLRTSEVGVLLDPTTKSRGRRAYLRVEVERRPDGAPARDSDGRLRVHLAGARAGGGQGSHVLSTLASADALAAVPEAFGEVPAGTAVDVFWLDR
ncbi:MAG: molybdopterin molybdotransferase MoeA [Candidatus Limnocylindrales bacterium]